MNKRTSVVLIVGLFLLSGCSTIASSNPAQTQSQTMLGSPAVGDCWNVKDGRSAADWSYWNGSPQVQCKKPHTEITYFVGQYPPTIQAQYTLGFDTIPTLLTTQAQAGCNSAGKQYGIDAPSIPTGRVSYSWFLPTPTQWASGARWYECRLQVTALWHKISSQVLAPLPASLVDFKQDLSWDPYKYGLCTETNGDKTADPYGAKATVVSCDWHGDWYISAPITLPGLKTASFPGKSKVAKAAESACEDSVSSWSSEVQWTSGIAEYYYYWPPTAQSWATGQRTVTCAYTYLN
jgi:Septum formation